MSILFPYFTIPSMTALLLSTMHLGTTQMLRLEKCFVRTLRLHDGMQQGCVPVVRLEWLIVNDLNQSGPSGPHTVGYAL